MPSGGPPKERCAVDDDACVRERLAASHVAIVGCGGLGSNAAALLVRSGVGELTLVDFDVVEESNLNRQLFFRDQLGTAKTDALAETLRRIQPDLTLHLVSHRVTEEDITGLVGHADVVIEAVDTVETKAMIASVLRRERPDTPLIAASGLAGFGPSNDVFPAIGGV